MARSIRAFVLSTLLGMSFIACNPAGEVRGTYTHSKDRDGSADLQANNRRSDRPSEEGVGLPGYSLNCAIDDVAIDQVEVGCHVASEDSNQRAPIGPGDWDRYDVSPPENVLGLTINKRQSPPGSNWDVIFGFRGLPQSELIDLANRSSYVMDWVHENGEIESLVAEPNTLSDSDSSAGNGNSNFQCSSGVLVNNICIFRTSISCTAACQRLDSQPHPDLGQILGQNSVDSSNRCRDIYQELLENRSVNFQLGEFSSAGYGCFQTLLGTVIHEVSALNASRFPPIGGSRLCGCQS